MNVKRGFLGFILLLFVFAAFACSKNSAPSGGPSSASPGTQPTGFELSDVRGAAALPLSLAVGEADSGFEVSVELSQVTAADDVFFKVLYDASRVSPAGVEFHGALGESVDLAITSVPGEVAVGSSRIREAGEPAVEISGLVATLKFKDGAFNVERRSSQAPKNAENKVTDLSAEIVGDLVTLTWTERNVGDYDNNGAVGIPDITAIALNYGKTSGSVMELVDGDGNGSIGISDITPIALNYGNSIAGYRINTKRGAGWEKIPNPVNPESPYTVTRPSSQPSDQRVVYTFQYTLDPADDENFQAAPIGYDNSMGIVSNSTGGGGLTIPAPPRVEDLTAGGGPDLGEGVIELKWTTPDDPYLSHQNVWWEAGGDGTNLIPYNSSVPPAASSLLVTGCDPGVTYHFRVWGTNYNEFGVMQNAAASNLASAIAFSPQGIPVIDDLGILSDASTGDGNIKLMWTVPSDPYLDHFEIMWQKGGDGSSLTVLDSAVPATANEYMVTGCEQGPRYFFKIKCAYEGFVGQPSNMVSSTAYPTPNIPPLSITEVTRNRTTFITADTINLGVTTNLDAQYASELRYEWSVAGGPGSISGGGDTKNPTASVSGQGTVTFQVRVTVNGADGPDYDKTGTVKVIGTSLSPVKDGFNGSNIFVLGGGYLFTALSYYQGPNHQFREYADDEKVILLNFWSYW